MATANAPPSAVGQALVGFSLDGLFPEEDVSSLALTADTLPAAIEALAAAKAKLEDDIHAIVDETADDVRAWTANAKALQADISRRKTLASEILVRANAPPGSAAGGPSLDEAEAQARFLTGELNYNLQVRYLLEAIRSVGRLLDRVEQAAGERRILDALRLLEKSWTALDAMPVSKSCRAMRLLDIRAFELKSDVHEVFDRVWGALVHVDADKATLSVLETRPDEPMSLSDAVIGLKAYKEVDARMAQLWHELDQAIVAPRMDLAKASRPAIYVDDSVLGTRGTAKDGIQALFADLEQIFSFFSTRLPPDLVLSVSSVMMPELVSRITDVWLASAVPLSLEAMDAFEGTVTAAQTFCARLTELQYSGFDKLQDWIENAPRVWLSKRRETVLDTVRKSIAQGVGSPHQVERVEKQMVSRSEGRELAANGPSAAPDQAAADWDTAWSDEEEPEESENKEVEEADDADAWAAWGDEDEPVEPVEPAEEAADEPKQPAEEEEPAAEQADEDDAADAWGWGDDDMKVDEPEPEPKPKPKPEPQQPSKSPRKPTKAAKAPAAAAGTETPTRELTLREKYYISSMPEPVLALIASILEDGSILTSAGYESSPVAAAAAGLFSLPTLILAMFRAVSPYYYALDVGGSMYLYNDAMYLAEKLTEVAASWKARAETRVRLDGEIGKLQAFASRAYGREMAVQKTVLRDLLGGDQSVLAQQQDDAAEDYVDAAVMRVRSMAAAWEDILAPSAWYQAVGALADVVAAKLIGDVLDMASISQDEAFNLANLIAKVTELDDLFLPAGETSETAETAEAAGAAGAAAQTPDQERLPMTAQYAHAWLRLQYLSEVLQSNLREVRYLWMESELSLCFSADEVVDLIRLSFEDNAKSREVAREIAQNPHPVEA